MKKEDLERAEKELTRRGAEIALEISMSIDETLKLSKDEIDSVIQEYDYENLHSEHIAAINTLINKLAILIASLQISAENAENINSRFEAIESKFN